MLTYNMFGGSVKSDQIVWYAKCTKTDCEKYKNSALYHGAILWNMLPVNIRNIDSFDSFKAHQKKAMKENG